MMPTVYSRFIAAADEILALYIANLPDPDLWPYIRVRSSITARLVKKGSQQRGVGVWHIEDHRKFDHSVPNFTQTWIGVFSAIPTHIALGAIKTDHPCADEMRSNDWVENHKRLTRQPTHFEPGDINLMSGYTWHRGGFASEDTYRSYMHLIMDIPRPAMKRLAIERSELLTRLPTNPPRVLRIPKPLWQHQTSHSMVDRPD
jgi:hypothetical protein